MLSSSRAVENGGSGPLRQVGSSTTADEYRPFRGRAFRIGGPDDKLVPTPKTPPAPRAVRPPGPCAWTPPTTIVDSSEGDEDFAKAMEINIVARVVENLEDYQDTATAWLHKVPTHAYTDEIKQDVTNLITMIETERISLDHEMVWGTMQRLNTEHAEKVEEVVSTEWSRLKDAIRPFMDMPLIDMPPVKKLKRRNTT